MDVDRKTLSERGVRMSMIVRRYGNPSHLASERVAVRLAEMLIEQEFGLDEIDLQRPLKITEFDDHWKIEGSRVPILSDVAYHDGLDGKVNIVIAKIDCQILDFTRDKTFPSRLRPPVEVRHPPD